MRKLQLYVTEHQYRLLKKRAAERGSIAQVVRELIDDAGGPTDPEFDAFYRHLMAEKEGSDVAYSAEDAKRDERRAWEIIVSFEDKDFSYTDATSFAVAESLGIDEAFSFDRHFREFGRLLVLPPVAGS